MRSPRSLSARHAEEDAAVLLQAEVVGFERAGDLNELRVVQQDGAEDESLGVQIAGSPFSSARPAEDIVSCITLPPRVMLRAENLAALFCTR